MSGILNSLVSARSAAVARSASPLDPVNVARAIAERHVSQGPTGVAAAPAGGSDADATANTDLRDLRIPQEMQTWLAPLLELFGIRLSETTISSAVVKPSQAHMARNGAWRSYVLHFPHGVLEDERYAQSIMTLNFCFKAGDQLRILSTGCREPLEAYELVWSDLANFNVTSEYIEWRQVETLQRQAEDPDRAANLLHRVFRLPNSVQRLSAPLAPQRLIEHQADFTALTGVVARIGPLQNLAVRNYLEDLMSQAALPVKVRAQGREWTDNFDVAARQFVEYLHNVGAEQGGTGYWHLARVMVAVARNDLVTAEERRSVLSILGRYGFMPDEERKTLQSELLPGDGP